MQRNTTHPSSSRFCHPSRPLFILSMAFLALAGFPLAEAHKTTHPSETSARHEPPRPTNEDDAELLALTGASASWDRLGGVFCAHRYGIAWLAKQRTKSIASRPALRWQILDPRDASAAPQEHYTPLPWASLRALRCQKDGVALQAPNGQWYHLQAQALPSRPVASSASPQHTKPPALRPLLRATRGGYPQRLLQTLSRDQKRSYPLAHGWQILLQRRKIRTQRNAGEIHHTTTLALQKRSSASRAIPFYRGVIIEPLE